MDTGVKRLDELLEGGMPQGACALVYGPPFLGKELLARLFFLTGLREGIPGILVLTGATAADARAQLAAMDKHYPEYEKSGLAHFVDCYSQSIGAEDGQPGTDYVDGPMNLNGLSMAVGHAQKRALRAGGQHRLVLDSVSTLIAYSNPQTTFRFLQVFIGKGKRAGATSLMLLEKGMHAEHEVQMVKHLMDGVIDFRRDNAKNLLHVEGIGVTEDRGWVEYRFGEADFDITGSFAAGRIR
jgi:KaiC/GvpD/RAD55 family RecA-like ATPase